MSNYPSLDSLAFLPYIDPQGLVAQELENKTGVYAIFDREQGLAYVGISRDVATSLKQHLVRVPDRCYWYKAWTIDSLDRNLLTEIQRAWQGDGTIDPQGWEKPIDCRQLMTEAEKESIDSAIDEVASAKILKNVARRIEEEIKQKLTDRGVTFDIRFNPKRKEEGLLDLKLW